MGTSGSTRLVKQVDDLDAQSIQRGVADLLDMLGIKRFSRNACPPFSSQFRGFDDVYCF
jgi:hypothetical protein